MLNYINSVIDESGTVDLIVSNSENDGTGFSGAAEPLIFTGPNGFSNRIVFGHATTGIHPFPGNPDGSATFNFGYTWNSEANPPTGSEFVLFTVSLHEVTHAMGFLSLVDENGSLGTFSISDSFLELGDGTPLFGVRGNFLGTVPDLISDDVLLVILMRWQLMAEIRSGCLYRIHFSRVPVFHTSIRRCCVS